MPVHTPDPARIKTVVPAKGLTLVRDHCAGDGVQDSIVTGIHL